MKFDITRAWKDESYRESLSNEQLRMLPANPAGELDLTDADLHSVYGGGGGCGESRYGVENHRIHSVAVTCDETAFSMNFNASPNAFSPIVNLCIA